MRIALPIRLGRVSQAADEATMLLLVDVGDGEEARYEIRRIDDSSLPRWVNAVSRLRVDLLICAAISRGLQELLEARGIRVLGNVSRKADRVLGAFMAGRLDGPRSACRVAEPITLMPLWTRKGEGAMSAQSDRLPALVRHALPPEDQVSGDGVRLRRRRQGPHAPHRERGTS
jgi:predicted Fe-Mo cluster-binding NifX family protein